VRALDELVRVAHVKADSRRFRLQRGLERGRIEWSSLMVDGKGT